MSHDASGHHDELLRRLEAIDYHADLIGYTDAAALAGVPEATVRQWKSRHHLHPEGKDERGRPLFRPIDVLRAEARTRHHARRRFPQAS